MAARTLIAAALLGAAAGCFDPPPFPTANDAARPDGGPRPDGAVADGAPADAVRPDATVDAPDPCTLPAFNDGLSTVAGCADLGDVDGARGSARFNDPVDLAVGPDGDVYVTDFDNSLLRATTPAGTVRTIIRDPAFQRPFGLAFAADGTLYVETDNDDLGAHSLQTGTLWQVDVATGEHHVLIRDIGRPRGLLVLADGRVAMADVEHDLVRVYDPASHLLSILAGKADAPGYVNGVGAAARFDGPYDLAQLPDGRLAVADFNNHRLRAVSLDGTVTLLAGAGTIGASDGPAAAAEFSRPQALAVDDAGALYVTDLDNFVVRRLRAGTVDTVIGDGVGGWLDAADPRAGRVFGLEGLDYDAVHQLLYLTDGSRGGPDPYHRVRVIKRSAL